VARANGVHHVVRFRRRKGLAAAFVAGIDASLRAGADIIVNTDADNQYAGRDIARLVAPLLSGQADIVIGDRNIRDIQGMSPLKKLLQRFGSWVVNLAADTKLPDAASGFRAYSKESLLRLNIVTQFSYCMETIIQAGNKRLRIASVPIETNPKTRESRLFRNMPEHMIKSAQAILRSYIMFKPFGFFAVIALIMFIAALIPFVRFLILNAWFPEQTNGNVQSLILGAAFLIGSLLALALGVLADLQRTNRVLMEEQLERTKEMQYGYKPNEFISTVDAVQAAAVKARVRKPR
jgi:hypothetical protein